MDADAACSALKHATVDPVRLRKQALKAGAKESPTGIVPVRVRLVETPGLLAGHY